MRHLLRVRDIPDAELLWLLDRADTLAKAHFITDRASSPLAGKTIINLFFEPSTRTLAAFELAGKKLGADVLSLPIATSSLQKGESILDTARTLAAMRPAVLVIRQREEGVLEKIAAAVSCSVVNAGEGRLEHPTQALADALTIRRRKGTLAGVRVAIIGDIAHSRVARSNVALLTRLGAMVHLIAPEALLPKDVQATTATRLFTNLKDGLTGADVVMALRVQRERMDEHALGQDISNYHLDRQSLAFAKPDAIVMHPGPMNRGVEIDGALADDPVRSAILEQVELGVAVRMACLEAVSKTGQKTGIDTAPTYC
ncbi:MAG: aspartate carbamoyltransferase catalytic subunit [Holosporales bacterium]|jgi:aspartate carbamoyltransferase catalytic subunit